MIHRFEINGILAVKAGVQELLKLAERNGTFALGFELLNNFLGIIENVFVCFLGLNLIHGPSFFFICDHREEDPKNFARLFFTELSRVLLSYYLGEFSLLYICSSEYFSEASIEHLNFCFVQFHIHVATHLAYFFGTK